MFPVSLSSSSNPCKSLWKSIWEPFLPCAGYAPFGPLSDWKIKTSLVYKQGRVCLLPGRKHLKIVETEEHLLLHCPALVSVRRRLFSRIIEFTADKTVLQTLLSNLFFQLDDAIKMQFLLDPSTLPAVISAFQTHGDEILAQCFKIGRMWCRSLHDSRLKLMD